MQHDMKRARWSGEEDKRIQDEGTDKGGGQTESSDKETANGVMATGERNSLVSAFS